MLYHMLVSTGKFANFRAESHVFDVLAPRFGGLRSAGDRRAAMRSWTASRHFQISGLDRAEITHRVVDECRNAGDVLRVMMETIAERQGVERWSDCTPAHLQYIPEITQQIPDALIIHIVRDGRDVGMSLARQGWVRPTYGDKADAVFRATLYWEWAIGRGRASGRAHPEGYFEISFEELIKNPQKSLDAIGEFIREPLDYNQILQSGVGSVSQPNTSFRGTEEGKAFRPVERWRDKLSNDEAGLLDLLVGETLIAFGYPLADTECSTRNLGIAWKARKGIYRSRFASKLWLKKRTALGRALTGLEALED